MSKFTKGPWLADIRSGCCAVYKSEDKTNSPWMHSDNDRNIYFSNKDAHYNGDYWVMSEEAIANAHLIAAAPEMYALLESLQLDVANEIKRDEILAKARGED